jgi:hypothetical protein
MGIGAGGMGGNQPDGGIDASVTTGKGGGLRRIRSTLDGPKQPLSLSHDAPSEWVRSCCGRKGDLWARVALLGCGGSGKEFLH